MKRLKYWLVLLPFLPAIVLAQNRGNDRIIPQKIPGLPGDTGSRFTTELATTINIVLGIVGLVTVAFLIWGGFRYITSAGDAEVAESAKKTIQNAIIGLVVIILSYVIVVVIARALISGDI